MTTKSGSLKIDVHDKLNALEKLGKALGLFQDAAPVQNVTVTQLNVSGPDTALEAARRLAFAIAAAQRAAKQAPEPLTIEGKAEEPGKSG